VGRGGGGGGGGGGVSKGRPGAAGGGGGGGGEHESGSVPRVRQALPRAGGSHGVPDGWGCDVSARRSRAPVARVADAARNGCAG